MTDTGTIEIMITIVPGNLTEDQINTSKEESMNKMTTITRNSMTTTRGMNTRIELKHRIRGSKNIKIVENKIAIMIDLIQEETVKKAQAAVERSDLALEGMEMLGTSDINLVNI